ncbi:apolipoprotein N-acyltransferase [Euzebya tangerina]|uniref:apolipoprotein N-acyltransferase n=1 Tax=Euzebya tangerina TaxID=591198 RepID=UPI0013C319DE|nr:apolipoprotein N-acyltransferase [Euzebya tangerina]
MLASSLPPRGWWPLGVAGIGLLGATLRDVTARCRFLLGALAGATLLTVGLWWATGLHFGGGIVLIACQGLLFGLIGPLVNPVRPWTALTGAVVLVEALRWRWPLSGLPFASPVLGQVDAPWVAIAPLAGSLGVLLVTAAVGGALAAGLAAGRGKAITMAAFSLALTPFVLSGPWPVSVENGRADVVRVAIVQGGGPTGTSAATGDPAVPLRRALALSADIPEETDLVVWAENVIQVSFPFEDSDVAASLGVLAAENHTTMLVGVTENDDALGEVPRFRNAAVVVEGDGQVGDRYEKVIRVPFGEYVPLRDLLARVVDLSRVPRDAIVGEGPPTVQTSLGTIGTVISFEAMFPQRVRAAVSAGGQFLVVPTNASSYVGPDVPAQQLAGARLRAMETGRAIAQAAPTGYSAIIDPDGTVRRLSQLGSGEVLTGEVMKRTALTPFVRFGDGPTLLAASVFVGVAWAPTAYSRWSRSRSMYSISLD